ANRHNFAGALEAGEIRPVAPCEGAAEPLARAQGCVMHDVDEALVIWRAHLVAGEVAEVAAGRQDGRDAGEGSELACVPPSSVSIISIRTTLRLIVLRYPPGTLPHTSGSKAWPPPRLRLPSGGNMVQSLAAVPSSTERTVGITITSAPRSIACWISRSSV